MTPSARRTAALSRIRRLNAGRTNDWNRRGAADVPDAAKRQVLPEDLLSLRRPRHCEDFGYIILRAIGLLVFVRVLTFHTASPPLRSLPVVCAER